MQKSAAHYTEAARDEVQLLAKICEGDPHDSHHCVRMTDSFDHIGPHGRHVCMVFEVRLPAARALLPALCSAAAGFEGSAAGGEAGGLPAPSLSPLP